VAPVSPSAPTPTPTPAPTPAPTPPPAPAPSLMSHPIASLLALFAVAPDVLGSLLPTVLLVLAVSIPISILGKSFIQRFREVRFGSGVSLLTALLALVTLAVACAHPKSKGNSSAPFTAPVITSHFDMDPSEYTYSMILSGIHPEATHIVVTGKSNLGFVFGPVFFPVARIGAGGQIDFPLATQNGIQYTLEAYAYNDRSGAYSEPTAAVRTPILNAPLFSQPRPKLTLTQSSQDPTKFEAVIDPNGVSIPANHSVTLIVGSTEGSFDVRTVFHLSLTNAVPLPNGTYQFSDLKIPGFTRGHRLAGYVSIGEPGRIGSDSTGTEFSYHPNFTNPSILFPAPSPNSPPTPKVISLENTDGDRTVTVKVDPTSLGSSTHLALYYQVETGLSHLPGAIIPYAVFVPVSQLRPISPTEAEVDFTLSFWLGRMTGAVLGYDAATKTYSAPTAVWSAQSGFTGGGVQETTYADTVQESKTLPSTLDITIVKPTTSLPANAYVVFRVAVTGTGPVYQIEMPMQSGQVLPDGKIRFEVRLPVGTDPKSVSVDVHFGQPKINGAPASNKGLGSVKTVSALPSSFRRVAVGFGALLLAFAPNTAFGQTASGGVVQPVATSLVSEALLALFVAALLYGIARVILLRPSSKVKMKRYVQGLVEKQIAFLKPIVSSTPARNFLPVKTDQRRMGVRSFGQPTRYFQHWTFPPEPLVGPSL